MHLGEEVVEIGHPDQRALAGVDEIGVRIGQTAVRQLGGLVAAGQAQGVGALLRGTDRRMAVVQPEHLGGTQPRERQVVETVPAHRMDDDGAPTSCESRSSSIGSRR